MEPRRTYVVSVYGAEGPVVVEAVQRDERARIADLEGLPECIRRWEHVEPQPERGSRPIGATHLQHGAAGAGEASLQIGDQPTPPPIDAGGNRDGH